MSKILADLSGFEPHWVQHNLPWLAVLAMLFGLGRDEPEAEGKSRQAG
jgi:hypothetical protein